MRKRWYFSKQGEFIFPIADGRIKNLGGDQELRTSTLIRHRPIQGESNIDFLGESEGSLPQPQHSFPDAGEAINDFWSMSRNFIYRHQVEPRVKLYSPRDESFPFPLKYNDVSRTTHTNLDVKQEKRIDDYWNVDGSRGLSDPWTGFTQFTLLDEKPRDGYMWSGRRLTRKQLTSRPDHLWPELWKSMGKHAKLKEKQKWSHEKPKLDNARKLRGIYFIDPEDKEFKETIKNARKKLETSVAPAMPCKISKNSQHWVTCGLNPKEIITPKRGETFYIPNRRWNSKIVWKRQWNSRINSEAGPTCKEWRSQRRPSRKFSGLDDKWWAGSTECYSYLRNVHDLLADRKTPCERRFGEQCEGPVISVWCTGSQPIDETKKDAEARNEFGQWKGFHFSSSCRTSSSTLRAERRNIPNTTACNLGRVARKPYWRELRNVDVDRNLSDSWTRFTKFPWQTWLFVAWNMVSKKWRAWMEHRKTKARQCSETERHLFHRSGRWRVQKNI